MSAVFLILFRITGRKKPQYCDNLSLREITQRFVVRY